jgi:hypothetical protein
MVQFQFIGELLLFLSYVLLVFDKNAYKGEGCSFRNTLTTLFVAKPLILQNFLF